MNETITGLDNKLPLDVRDNVYYLTKPAAADVTGIAEGWQTERARTGEKTERHIGVAGLPSAVRLLNQALRNQLHDAFHKITDSLDSDLGQSERSNAFDEWIDLLQVLSRRGQDLTGNHRKILGALISSVGNKDISDFDKQHLLILQEATNVLRQPSVTKSESKRVISILIKSGFEPILNLSAENLTDESIKELEKMRAALLGISQ